MNAVQAVVSAGTGRVCECGKDAKLGRGGQASRWKGKHGGPGGQQKGAPGLCLPRAHQTLELALLDGGLCQSMLKSLLMSESALQILLFIHCTLRVLAFSTASVRPVAKCVASCISSCALSALKSLK